MEKHKYLITVDVENDEVYIDLHQDKSIREAMHASNRENNNVCFAITPENALELAKGLIDIAYTGKIIDKAIAKVELDLKDNEES
jgi:hypothetical protein